jgi:molybdopterin converting factor subunit 1
MRVCVLYFGVLKDLVGHGRSEMDLAESASVAELLEAHRRLVKGRESLWDSIAVAVNQEYARAGDVLKDGDEVALLPPVSGGSLVFAVGTGELTPGAKAPEFSWRIEGQG